MHVVAFASVCHALPVSKEPVQATSHSGLSCCIRKTVDSGALSGTHSPRLKVTVTTMDSKHDAITCEGWLRGSFTYMLYR
jgi:hypothetical protein